MDLALNVRSKKEPLSHVHVCACVSVGVRVCVCMGVGVCRCLNDQKLDDRFLE